jgi:hypothetical protein
MPRRWVACFAQVVPHITDAIQQWIKSTAKLPVDSLDQEARPRLRRDWAHPCHIRTGTGLTPATSAPGLGSLDQEVHSWSHHPPLLGTHA